LLSSVTSLYMVKYIQN